MTLSNPSLQHKTVARQAAARGAKVVLAGRSLEALGKHLAKELAPRRVNVISPGVTATEAYAGMPEEARQAMFARTAASLPVGRVGQPDDIAAAFILAMENGFISGSLIDVDGGGLL